MNQIQKPITYFDFSEYIFEIKSDFIFKNFSNFKNMFLHSLISAKIHKRTINFSIYFASV